VPIHAEDYVHRVGRTGRAGRAGQAFTLACREDAKYVKAIEGLIKKEIPKFDLEGSEAAPAAEAPVAKAPVAQGPRRAAAPKRERAPREERPPREEPSRGRRRDHHPGEDAPDHAGFNQGNMPAFLMRPGKAG
jgi:superfamily II DNA/RNA helicase